MKTLALALATALAATLAAAAALVPQKSSGIPDRSLGLSKTSVFEVPAPPLVKENDSAPGERPAPPRVHEGAAPVIPHGVEDFLPITLEQNSCIDCHGVEKKVKGEPTPIPPSHYTDLRRDPRKPGKEVVGARWTCVSCHVPQHDVLPLVPNVTP
jgi:nitrate reductase (cytochrome), electron transfer subunit